MKKLIYIAFAAMAAAFALSSCVKDNMGNKSGEATVTLSVDIVDGIVTKAYGDGMYASKNVIVGVFDENGVEKFRKNYVWDAETLSQEIQIRFVMGKKYQMVVFAQYGNAYGDPATMSLEEITLDYTASNRENLDAFYAHVPVFEVKQDFTMPIVLRRPFAQLNFATTINDLDESTDDYLGLSNKASVTVKNVANTLNLFTGETYYVDGDGEVEATGVAVVIPETEFPIVNNKRPQIEVNGEKYEIISMNYILVADHGSEDGKTTVDLTLKVGDLEINVPSAYMKRNWRTNVVGELLTAEGTFSVTIDPIFDGAFDTTWGE
jgi:hypothetical protein